MFSGSVYHSSRKYQTLTVSILDSSLALTSEEPPSSRKSEELLLIKCTRNDVYNQMSVSAGSKCQQVTVRSLNCWRYVRLSWELQLSDNCDLWLWGALKPLRGGTWLLVDRTGVSWPGWQTASINVLSSYSSPVRSTSTQIPTAPLFLSTPYETWSPMSVVLKLCRSRRLQSFRE